MTWFGRMLKANPYHDKEGKFTTAENAVTVNHDLKNPSAVEGRKIEAKNLAMRYAMKARSVEPKITQALQEASAGIGQLLGLEFRLKGEDSIARKIAGDAIEKRIPLAKAAAALGDLVRYTVASPPEQYTTTVEKTMAKLRSLGMEIVPGKFKNYWAKEGQSPSAYQGINTNWRTRDGVVFELQFHTPESHATKEGHHKEYEEWRLFGPDANLTQDQLRRKVELSRYMIERQERVKKPANVHALSS